MLLLAVGFKHHRFELFQNVTIDFILVALWLLFLWRRSLVLSAVDPGGVYLALNPIGQIVTRIHSRGGLLAPTCPRGFPCGRPLARRRLFCLHVLDLVKAVVDGKEVVAFSFAEECLRWASLVCLGTLRLRLVFL
mmetsp:Transcript_20679/g.27912  ORF Transcript_20679/g.27912 Transcript_20679/m.27912 type:complete len:135 (-) Transcript_20679:752-1156(-)